MSKLELFRDFYDYNTWATSRLLDTASAVPEEELGEVIATLAHVIAAQINWLERWQTGVNKRPTDELTQSFNSLPALRDAADRSHADLHRYLGAVTDADLERRLPFRDSSGTQQSDILWQMMLHVANHGTYHRGEAALMLTNLGHSPGDLDLGDWAEAHEG